MDWEYTLYLYLVLLWSQLAKDCVFADVWFLGEIRYPLHEYLLTPVFNPQSVAVGRFSPTDQKAFTVAECSLAVPVLANVALYVSITTGTPHLRQNETCWKVGIPSKGEQGSKDFS